MHPFLSKKTSYLLILALIYLDAFLDLLINKGMSNPMWIPLTEHFGRYIVLVLAFFVWLLIMVIAKPLAKIVKKIDKTPYSEEILLTAFVVVYGLFDLWLIAVDFFGFGLIVNYKYTIPFLAIGGLIYALWAQNRVRK